MHRRPLVTVLLLAIASPVHADESAELFRKSYALEATNDTSGALAALERIGGDHERDYTYQLRHAWLLYVAARYSDSVDAYRRAASLAPRSIEARLGEMLPLMAARRWSEAEQLGSDVLRDAPADYWALSRLAYIDFQQGRYLKAEAGYRRVLERYPSDVEMRSGLGWSLLKQGEAASARREFEAVLAVAPDQSSAQEGEQAAADR